MSLAKPGNHSYHHPSIQSTDGQVDPTKSLLIEARIKIDEISSEDSGIGGHGAYIQCSDGQNEYGIYFMEKGLNIRVEGDDQFLNLNFDHRDFHVYQIYSPANSNRQYLFIDGELRLSGNTRDRKFNTFSFGDGFTPQGNAANAMWDYLRVTQGVDFPHTNPPGIQPRELVLRLDGQDPDGDGLLGGTPPNGDWIDKSGFGHDASNVVGLDIAKPTYDPSLFGGRGGFVFEGNQGLESPFNFGGQFEPGADYTTFVVFNSNNNGSMFISADRPSNGPTHFTGLLDGQACVRVFAGTTLHTDEDHFSDGDTHVLTYSVSTANDGKNTSSYFFTDEIQQPAPDVGNSNQSSSLVLGTRINESNQVSSQFHGEIAEFIIFKGTLSVQETKDIHAYLLSRWGESQKAIAFELFQNASRSRGRMLIDPGSEPPLDPQSIHLDDKNLPPKDPDSDLLVVIVHGWRSSPNGNEGNFVDIRDGISFHS